MGDNPGAVLSTTAWPVVGAVQLSPICSGFLSLCSKPPKTKQHKQQWFLLRPWILWVGNFGGTGGTLFCSFMLAKTSAVTQRAGDDVKSLQVRIGGVK